MSEARWSRLAEHARRDTPGRVDVGGGIEAVTGPGVFTLRRKGDPPARSDSPPVPLAAPGSAEWGGGRVVVSLDPRESRNETVDLDRLIPPLWVRAPKPGDRFNPLGMGDRETPLNDFFRGRGVAPERRAETPLVCDEQGIVWVVGHRIAHRVRLTEGTVRPAGLRWEGRETPPPSGPSSCR
jgi:tRNA(Ile)-lysidine synthase